MAKDLKGPFRRGWEWLGHIHLAEWVWTLIVSALNGIGVGYAAWWEWATHWGYIPVYLAGVGAFTFTIWLINGIIWLRRQQRPSQARISFDYSYAMALEDVEFGTDYDNINNTLQVRPKFRNVANGPVKFIVEKPDIRIEDRISSAQQISGVLPRATLRTIIAYSGFNRVAYDQFREQTRGTMEYIIKYGHPDDEYSRQTSGIVDLDIQKQIDENGRRTTKGLWYVARETDQIV